MKNNLWKKLSFLRKVQLIYSLIILIPIIILACFIWYTSNLFIREQQRIEVKALLERNAQDIVNQMEQCEKSILYLASNMMLADFLVTDEKNYMSLLKQSENVSPLIYNAQLSSRHISKINVYSEKNFSVSKDLFKPFSLDDKWYHATVESTNALWWYMDGDFFVTRCVRHFVTGKPLGVIKAELRKDAFEQCLKSLKKIPVDIQIQDENNIIYQCVGKEDPSEVEFKLEIPLEKVEWIIAYTVRNSYFTTFFHPIIMISLFIILLLVIIAWQLVNYSTKYLLKNLFTIINDVNKIQNNNFEIEVDETSEDEIGELAKSINCMLKKIQLLIKEVYVNELEKKSLELDLLKAKINPHFLYNNLSAINWIAIEKGEMQIYEITTQMATFYRTALNKGKNVDCLRIEIENIKAYLNLQLYAHDNSFEIEYDIDEKLMDIRIPMFIMQPLVENALEHGIDTIRQGQKKIYISIKEYENNILIEICDSGLELFSKIGNKVMDPQNYGYGLKNVESRIQLLCGKSCGISIMASENGTKSIIKLKKEIISL